MRKGLKKRKKLWLLILIPVVLGLIIGAFFLFRDKAIVPFGSPILSVQTPQKQSVGTSDTVIVDVTISDFGKERYPAASMSIAFDPNYLEFIGIKEGNVMITGDTQTGVQLPSWSCNPEASNRSGKINLMYLDLTAGKYAFSRDLLQKDDNVVVRLEFRFRGSVRAGDIYDLTVLDAIFAASEEEDSLSMAQNTLNVKYGKIVMGE